MEENLWTLDLYQEALPTNDRRARHGLARHGDRQDDDRLYRRHNDLNSTSPVPLSLILQSFMSSPGRSSDLIQASPGLQAA